MCIRGPGSDRVSEIDISSPLNSGTPGSIGSSLRTPRTGSKGALVRVRSDIQSDRRLQTVNLPSSQDGIPMSQGDKLK